MILTAKNVPSTPVPPCCPVSILRMRRPKAEGGIMPVQPAAFTGSAAQLGVPFYQRAKVYFDQVNVQEGFAWQQI